MLYVFFIIIFFLGDFGPKWSSKPPHGVIMGGNYSQTPDGDFWIACGNILSDNKTPTIMQMPTGWKAVFLTIHTIRRWVRDRGPVAPGQDPCGASKAQMDWSKGARAKDPNERAQNESPRTGRGPEPKCMGPTGPK